MRKIKKKLISLLLVTTLLTGCSRFGMQQKTTEEFDYKKEGKYPVTWDLESVYASEEEWYADYDKAYAMLSGYDKFKGKLNNAKTIKEYFDFSYFTELTRIQSKLYMYAKLGYGLDATDPVFMNMNAKLDAMTREESRRNAFADDEIFALSLEERKDIFSDEIWGGDTYWLRRYVDPDYEPLNEDETNIVSTLSMGLGYGEQIFDILNNVELPYAYIKMPSGDVRELTDELYGQIISSPMYKTSFKIEANQVYLSRYKNLANTFATLLEENCSQAYSSALLEGYDSTLEEAFSDYDLDTEVFDMLVDAARKGIPEYQRFLRLHAEALGLEEQYSFNVGAPVSDYYPDRIYYDDAVDEVIDALSVLGTDYTDHFKTIIGSGHVDVYPAENKDTGAYESKNSSDYLPWVLFNFEGYSEDVSTIAHEMGHAVYDQYSTENQPRYYDAPTVFTQEVASTTNELLYYNYKMANAADDEEKLYYLEEAIQMFAGTFFTQMLYSEFEDYMYKTVEDGGALDAESLSDKWAELYQQYRGDTVIMSENARYSWASVPHLYYVYYVYQYAADVTYAASIAQRITSGEENASEEYIDFLKLGGSMSPVDLLSEAGIDPLAESTYDEALEYFSSLVDEYERLIKNM